MTREHLIFTAYLLRRTEHKPFENYVLTGICHMLNFKGIELKLITLQTVFRNNAKHQIAYLDAYFPALNIQIEVDEQQHLQKKHAIEDKVREVDIMKVLGALDIEPDVIRIDATSHASEDLDTLILHAVDIIIDKYNESGKPLWTDTDIYDIVLKQKCIKFNDNFIFRYKNDLLNVLGLRTNDGKLYSRNGTQNISTIAYNNVYDIWFPHLNNNISLGWKNSYDFKTHTFTTLRLNSYKRNYRWKDSEEKFKHGIYKDRYIIFKAVDSMNNHGFKYYGKYKCIYCNARIQKEVWKLINLEDIKIEN